MDPLDPVSMVFTPVMTAALQAARPEQERPSEAQAERPTASVQNASDGGMAAATLVTAKALPVAQDPPATIMRAEELSRLTELGQSSEAGMRMAGEAYRMEVKAQSELQRMRAESPEGLREWFV